MYASLFWIALSAVVGYSSWLITLNLRQLRGFRARGSVATMAVLLTGIAAVANAGTTTQPSLSAQEKDRKAILSMAGTYEVNFHFEETVPLKPGYALHDPHDEHAKELVLVITDQPNRIELQHLLVVQTDVIKHWRQEWVYENRDLLEYRGMDRWEHRTLSADEARGTWTQRVFNVDDGPRYEGFGKWEHGGNWTAWESNETWRPLPRREYTTRSDYQVILGRNRHLLTPTGWVHEQDNAKVVLDAARKPVEALALERGLNSYDKCDPQDVKLAVDYWAKTAPYWATVRAAWGDIFSTQRPVEMFVKVENRMLYKDLFEYLDQTQASAKPDPAAQQAKIKEILGKFMKQSVATTK